jgi:Ca2+-transporting ATPase
MGEGGTEVAREAADMVLLDDDFSTIVVAIREGRRVFDNIRKFVKYTLTSNAGGIWTLLLAPFVGLPLPLLPIQILWINLVTDGLPGLALAAEPEERGIMRRPPRPPGESIFAHGLGAHALWIGLLIAGLSLGGLAWSHAAGTGNWQSVVFTVLTFSQLAHVLVIRREQDSVFGRAFLGNLPLLGAVLLTVLLQFAVVFVPWLQPIFGTSGLTGAELVVCLALPLVVVIAGESEKLLARRGLLYARRGVADA